jgi:hypothetical protein
MHEPQTFNADNERSPQQQKIRLSEAKFKTLHLVFCDADAIWTTQMQVL